MRVSLNRPLPRLAGVAAFSVLFSWMALPWTPVLRQQEPAKPPVAVDTAAALFPADTLVYLEADGLGEWVDGVLDGSLARRVEGSASYAAFRTRPEAAKLLAGLGFAQMLTGRPPHEALAELLGTHVSVGLVVSGGEPALLAVIEHADEQGPSGSLDLVRRVAALGEGSPYREVSRHGVTTAALNDRLFLAAPGRFLCLSNVEGAIADTVDRLLSGESGLSTSPVRDEMNRSQAPIRWLAQLDRISALMAQERWIPERQEVPLVSLLLGDLLEVAAHCPRVFGEADADPEGVRVRARWPVDPASLPPRLRSYCHAQAHTMRLPELATHETFLTLTAWRDVATWWEDRGELMSDATETGFAEFDTTLATFFGGRRFSDELLPMLAHEWVLIGARQTYADRLTAPDLRFPAGALVMRSDQAVELEQDLRIALGSVMGLVNVQRGQNGLAPFLVFSEPAEGFAVHGARPVEGTRYAVDAVQGNLSPCVTRVGDRVVLGTSEALVRDLATGLVDAAPSNLVEDVVTRLSLHLEPGLQALRDNLEVLIGNTVLEKGKPHAQASFEWNLLLELGAQFRSIVAESRVQEDGFLVTLNASFAPEAAVGNTPSAAEAPTPASSGTSETGASE